MAATYVSAAENALPAGYLYDWHDWFWIDNSLSHASESFRCDGGGEAISQQAVNPCLRDQAAFRDSVTRAARGATLLAGPQSNPTKRSKKLAEILEAQGDLPSLPNVAVHDKKIGPVQREIAVGRWKVIEEELKKRDLPVTGTAGLGKNMERDWLTGKA
ncbi:hypothetical protein NM208_g6516 [Fusarium decemcellulare]|uniref:Uncharacterized protein n=1 Tax=Fusarium decemcellulare TaxID=57161 RepID=A0ACC1SCL5_9HYPO|nr:hypothetical protein NM208_g6516 [Fusarium decemcellulare]